MFLSSYFFSPSNLGGLWADRRQTLPHVRRWLWFFKLSQKFAGSLPQKIWRPKNIKISEFAIRFRISPDGTRYRHSENGVGNCNHSPTCVPNLVNFGPQMAKNRTGISTHSNDFYGRSYLSSHSVWDCRRHVTDDVTAQRVCDREKFDPYSVVAIPIYREKRIRYLAHHRVHKKLTRWKRRRRIPTPRWGNCLS